MKKLNRNNVKYAIVHHSGSDIKAHDNVLTLRNWHLERGFDDIGYTYVITKDGTIRNGRSISFMGAHTLGHNHESIGICLTGDVAFSPAQFISLGRLLERLKEDFPGIVAKGHDHFANTECPGFSI